MNPERCKNCGQNRIPLFSYHHQNCEDDKEYGIHRYCIDCICSSQLEEVLKQHIIYPTNKKLVDIYIDIYLTHKP